MRLFHRKRIHHVILYSKPGCHLCEDARSLLDKLDRRYRLRTEEVDIRSDPELFRRYDIRIPVILIDGTTELEAPITQARLERALE